MSNAGQKRRSSRGLYTLALLSLTLHALVPSGFMPAPVDSGWFLKWCPEGLTTRQMQALFADKGHNDHHHHHHSQDQADTKHQPFQLCDLSGLSAEACLPQLAPLVDDGLAKHNRTSTPHNFYLPSTYTAYHSRAPPSGIS